MAKIINVFHIVVVAPLLWSLATNRFPEEYKHYIVWLVYGLVLYHLYKLFFVKQEHMDNVVENDKMHHIKIFDSYPGYDQPNIKINKGDVVTWTNIGEVEHSVTSDNGNFDSGYLKPGQSFALKFDFTGDFTYHCIHHKGWMTGIITVN